EEGAVHGQTDFEKAAVELARLVRRRASAPAVAMPMAAGSYLARFAVPGRGLWRERLVGQGALIMTADGDVYHEDQVPSRNVRGTKPLSWQGDAVDGFEVASVYRSELLPAAVQARDTHCEAVAGGAGALPPEDFVLELGEASVLGRPDTPPGARAGDSATPPAGEPPCGDPRVLAVARVSRGRCDRSFGDAPRKQSVYERDDWPVRGPQTVLGVLQLVLRMAGGAVARLTRGLAFIGLAEGIEAVKQLETICRILEASRAHVQLVIPELASFECLARQLQLIGHGKKDSTAQDARSTEVGLFLGIGRTKGNACICPALMQFFAEQVQSEAATSNERRKAREERALRAPWRPPRPLAFASGMLCRCRPSTRAIVFAPLTVGGPAGGRLVARLGAGSATRASTLSTGSMIVLVRGVSLVRMWSALRRSMLLSESCKSIVLSTTPGYQNASRVRPYDKARVAWPALSGPPVEVGSVAQQADAFQLQGWRQSMLRSAGEVEELQESLGVQQPYVDPLLRDPRKYAEFLNAMLQRHVIEWAV
ncbi:unnamed protein product, partial [Prorocentrum cordatum]